MKSGISLEIITLLTHTPSFELVAMWECTKLRNILSCIHSLVFFFSVLTFPIKVVYVVGLLKFLCLKILTVGGKQRGRNTNSVSKHTVVQT